MAKRLVRAAVVVKGNPISKPLVQLATIGIALEINILVLEAAPQPLDEDVVHPAAAAIHGDLDAGPFERTGEGHAGELAALVGVEEPKRSNASSSAATQNDTSVVLDSRQLSTARLAQSMMATR
jgi:hypothetical protein